MTMNFLLAIKWRPPRRVWTTPQRNGKKPKRHCRKPRLGYEQYKKDCYIIKYTNVNANGADIKGYVFSKIEFAKTRSGSFELYDDFEALSREVMFSVEEETFSRETT